MNEDFSPGQEHHPPQVGRAVVKPVAIVVGLDGSPTSWDAFSWAAGEAKRNHGQLIAVYVTPTVEPDLGAIAGLSFSYLSTEPARSDTATRLRMEAEHHARELGVDLTFVRAFGDTAQELVRAAQAAHCDLIVVGRSEKTLHRMAGSLGRRLVCHRRAPIVVVVP